MKATLIGIGVAIVVLAAGAVAIGYYLGIFGARAPGSSPSTPPAASASPRPSPPVAIVPAVTAPAASPAPGSPGSSVNFELAITSITGSGLSRTIGAQITNTGSAAAHNVWAKVEVSAQGQKLQLSGQDYLRVDIGTLNAGAAVTKQVDISFSLTDGLRIQQSGAQFLLTVYSDERTQALTYNYTP